MRSGKSNVLLGPFWTGKLGISIVIHHKHLIWVIVQTYVQLLVVRHTQADIYIRTHDGTTGVDALVVCR